MTSNSYPTFDTWAETSSRVFNTFLEANRAANKAAFSAFGSPVARNGNSKPDTGCQTLESRLEPGQDLEGWETTRLIEGQLSVGDAVQFSKTITEDDIERFAAASGDTNPIHLDDGFAQGTRFKGRIAHGILVSGLISAALARLPGSIVYLSQDLEFRAPVRIGDELTATVEIVEDLGGDQYRIQTTVSKIGEDDPVVDGEAVVLVDEPPADD